MPIHSVAAVVHDCRTSMDCGSTAAGHGLSFLQERLATAAKYGWRDGFVESVRDGWISVRDFEGGRVRVWSHAGDAVEPGEPVSVHDVYDVLAIGAFRLNVLRGQP
jgi:hypothetical protein